jgi:hypothetical protein
VSDEQPPPETFEPAEQIVQAQLAEEIEPIEPIEPIESLQDPSWREIDWRLLDWNSVRAERFAGGIFFGIVGTGLLIGLVVLTLFNWPPGAWIGLLWAGWAVLILGFGWLAHFLPAIAYRRTTYRLGKLGFEIQRGIFWRRRVTVPISRVQHTDVAQGPLQRRYEIGKLIVYTAGTQNASVELDGLNFAVASQLRDSLIVAGESTDGV